MVVGTVTVVVGPVSVTVVVMVAVVVSVLTMVVVTTTVIVGPVTVVVGPWTVVVGPVTVRVVVVVFVTVLVSVLGGIVSVVPLRTTVDAGMVICVVSVRSDLKVTSRPGSLIVRPDTVMVRGGSRTFLTPFTVTILPRRVISNVRVADAAGLLPTASPTSTPAVASSKQVAMAGTTSHRGYSPNSQRNRAINARMQNPLQWQKLGKSAASYPSFPVAGGRI
jgi:hypothetical protein